MSRVACMCGRNEAILEQMVYFVNDELDQMFDELFRNRAGPSAVCAWDARAAGRFWHPAIFRAWRRTCYNLAHMGTVLFRHSRPIHMCVAFSPLRRLLPVVRLELWTKEPCIDAN